MAGMRLRMITLPTSKSVRSEIATLITFSGGQGSINVNSWAPDSSRFAFVSYELLP
jgi:TolB protein